jgi:hypothetical protein
MQYKFLNSRGKPSFLLTVFITLGALLLSATPTFTPTAFATNCSAITGGSISDNGDGNWLLSWDPLPDTTDIVYLIIFVKSGDQYLDWYDNGDGYTLIPYPFVAPTASSVLVSKSSLISLMNLRGVQNLDLSVRKDNPVVNCNPVTFLGQINLLAAPAFTLSSISETANAASAVSGYTINSTGGAIASYSISPTISNGLSFSTTTGLISGTPTAQASAVTYTITATNATSTANATFSLTVNPNPAIAAAAAAEAARIAASAAEAARNAAAAAAQKQRELTEILSVIPAIAGLAFNLAVLTTYLFAPEKSFLSKVPKPKMINTKSLVYLKATHMKNKDVDVFVSENSLEPVKPSTEISPIYVKQENKKTLKIKTGKSLFLVAPPAKKIQYTIKFPKGVSADLVNAQPRKQTLAILQGVRFTKKGTYQLSVKTEQETFQLTAIVS